MVQYFARKDITGAGHPSPAPENAFSWAGHPLTAPGNSFIGTGGSVTRP